MSFFLHDSFVPSIYLPPCNFFTALNFFCHSPPQRDWIANVVLAAAAACANFKQGIFVDVRLGKCGFALDRFRRDREGLCWPLRILAGGLEWHSSLVVCWRLRKSRCEFLLGIQRDYV